MTKLNYTFHSDAGHGWLAVKRKELQELNILDKVSGYSYVSKSGQTVYLEEDGDLSMFVTIKIVKGAPSSVADWNIKNSYKDYSHIRSLQSFSM